MTLKKSDEEGRYNFRPRNSKEGPSSSKKQTNLGQVGASAASDKSAAQEGKFPSQQNAPSPVKTSIKKSVSKMIGKRKRPESSASSESMESKVKSPETEQVDPRIVEVRGHLTQANILMQQCKAQKCYKCSRFLLQQFSVKHHVQSWSSTRTRINRDRNLLLPLTVVPCPSISCHGSTCVVCGKGWSQSFKHHREREMDSSLDVHCDCYQVRAMELWFLLSYFDEPLEREPPVLSSIRSQISQKVGSAVNSTVKALKRKSRKAPRTSQPNGVGYATTWDEASDVGTPPYLYDGYSSEHETVPLDEKESEKEHSMKVILEFIRSAMSTDWQYDQIIMIWGLLAISNLPVYLADLLRNDSIADASKRLGIYKVALNLVEELHQHTFLTRLVHDTLPTKKQSVPLIQISLEGADVLNQGTRFSVGASIVRSMENIRAASQSVSLAATTVPEAYKDKRGLQILELCKLIQETGEKIDPRPKTIDLVECEEAKLEFKPSNERVETMDLKDITARYLVKGWDKFQDSTVPKRMRRLFHDLTVLKTSLPPGIFVKVADCRPDMIKALIIGPADTPYEGGLFEFDLLCTSKYPQTPPQVHCVTASHSAARLNPNLYENGYVCLSLLGTWSGASAERWQPAVSTILQVLVSIQSMIFVNDPGANEPGMATSDHKDYSQRTFRRAQVDTVQAGLIPWLRDTSLKDGVWKEIVESHFRHRKHALIKMVREWSKDNTEITNFQRIQRQYMEDLHESSNGEDEIDEDSESAYASAAQTKHQKLFSNSMSDAQNHPKEMAPTNTSSDASASVSGLGPTPKQALPVENTHPNSNQPNPFVYSNQGTQIPGSFAGSIPQPHNQPQQLVPANNFHTVHHGYGVGQNLGYTGSYVQPSSLPPISSMLNHTYQPHAQSLGNFHLNTAQSSTMGHMLPATAPSTSHMKKKHWLETVPGLQSQNDMQTSKSLNVNAPEFHTSNSSLLPIKPWEPGKMHTTFDPIKSLHVSDMASQKVGNSSEKEKSKHHWSPPKAPKTRNLLEELAKLLDNYGEKIGSKSTLEPGNHRVLQDMMWGTAGVKKNWMDAESKKKGKK